jgi:hypothetical protein
MKESIIEDLLGSKWKIRVLRKIIEERRTIQGCLHI